MGNFLKLEHLGNTDFFQWDSIADSNGVINYQSPFFEKYFIRKEYTIFNEYVYELREIGETRNTLLKKSVEPVKIAVILEDIKSQWEI